MESSRTGSPSTLQHAEDQKRSIRRLKRKSDVGGNHQDKEQHKDGTASGLVGHVPHKCRGYGGHDEVCGDAEVHQRHGDTEIMRHRDQGRVVDITAHG